MFELGRNYSRDEISAKLGGSKQKYLPHSSCRVVCGCFKEDLDPNAPGEVLPGNSDDIIRWARVFAGQLEPIPIFIKRSTSRWEYVGRWKVSGAPIEDPRQIAPRARQTGRGDISMILRLVRA